MDTDCTDEHRIESVEICELCGKSKKEVATNSMVCGGRGFDSTTYHLVQNYS